MDNTKPTQYQDIYPEIKEAMQKFHSLFPNANALRSQLTCHIHVGREEGGTINKKDGF